MRPSPTASSAQGEPWESLYERFDIGDPATDVRPFWMHIADHARVRPSTPALFFGGRIFTYEEYDKEADRLAMGLRQLGLNPGDVVGLHMPNIPQYAFAVAALSKLGLIACGVSPLLTVSEIEFQVKDAGMRAILSMEELPVGLYDLKAAPENLDFVIMASVFDYLGDAEFTPKSIKGVGTITYRELVDAVDGPCEPVVVAPSDIAVLQYTGGTTGKPKGAEVSLFSIMYNIEQAAAGDEPPVLGAEVFAGVFPLFHGAGLAAFMGAMRFGGLFLLLLNPRDVQAFCEFMQAHPPTYLAAVPALYEMLLSEDAFLTLDFNQLKVARSGAAPLASETASRLEALIGPQKLSEVIGMTETGPVYTIHPTVAYKRGSVGVPAPGVKVKIVDVENPLLRVAIGTVGEICVSGPNLMKGYRNRPTETDDALREDHGTIWMHTGDVGYMDDEGYIYLCDRMKDMLIVGGYKVFSVEVEDKLKDLPEIEACAIVGRPDLDRPGNDVVVLVAQKSQKAMSTPDKDLTSGILAFCRAHMAAYKVPKDIRFIDEMPLTAVGKIDKKAVRSLIQQQVA